MPRYWLRLFPWSPCWYICWSENGRDRRRSTGETDRAKADLVLAAFQLEQAAAAGRPATKELTIATLLDRYCTGHTDHLPGSQQARIAEKHITGYFGLSGLDALTPLALSKYAESRQATRPKGVKPEKWKPRRASNETINREFSVLKAALNLARRQGLIESIPAIPTLPSADARQRWLTRAEAARLLWASRAGPPYLKLFIRIAIYTGARREAILGLTWQQIDLHNRRIDFALPGRKRTNKRRAVVPIAGALLRALEKAYSERKGQTLFQVANVRGSLSRAGTRAKLGHISANVLRHTTATWIMMSGGSLWDGMKMLGHSKPATFLRYAKNDPDYLRDITWRALRGTRK